MEEPAPAPEGYYPPEEVQPSIPQRPPSMLPPLAGFLLILAGISGLASWSLLLTTDPSMYMNLIPANSQISSDAILKILQTCGVIALVFSAIAFVGGIMALRRKSWGIASLGSILGIFTIGVLYSGTIFSLIALILLLISRKEFTK